MSRGPGRVQAGILRVLATAPNRSAAELAEYIFGNTTATALASVRRALGRLIAVGQIIQLPPVIGMPNFYGLAVSEKRHQARQRAKARQQAREREDRERAARYHAGLGVAPQERLPETLAGRDKLAKILGLLGSDKDGEVLAAARRAEQQRKKMALSWAELLGAV
jgi:hypothetical protein